MSRFSAIQSTGLLILLALVAGCIEGDRLIGTWQGTYDGEEHVLKFTGTGRLWQSTNLIGKRDGWTKWEASEERGLTVSLKAGGQDVVVKFRNSDSMELRTDGVRINMQRIKEADEEDDGRSWATAYLLLTLAVAFGLVAVCRPSRRGQHGTD